MDAEESRVRALFAATPTILDEDDNEGGGTPAAVLVPLVRRDDGLRVLLTRRSDNLEHHAGQISFPGGRIEAEDPTPAHAALREAWEETGLPAAAVELLGTLPHYRTTTGFTITPAVGLVTPPFTLRLQAQEVVEAFELPFRHFCQPAHYRRKTVHVPGLGERRYFEITCQGRYVWGATAGILWRLGSALNAQG